MATKEEARRELARRELARRREAATSAQPAPAAPSGFSPVAEADAYESVRGTNAFADATEAAMRGIPFSDEISSGVAAPFRAAGDWMAGRGFDIPRAYDERMQVEEELRRRQEERSPVATTVGQVAGGMALGGTAARWGASLLQGARPTIGSLAGRGAAEGAAYGAAYGAGEGRGLSERGYNALYGAGTGATVGAVTGALARIGAGGRATSATADDLEDLGRQAYRQADQAGVVFTPQAMQRTYGDLVSDFSDFGFLPANQPGAAAVLREIERQSAGNVTLKGLDTIRKMAGNAYMPGNRSNNALTTKIIDRIDGLIDSPQSGDVLAGNAQAGAEAMQTARDYWSRGSKLRRVSQLLDRAEVNAGSSGTGGNVENATRQQLKRILTSDSMKRGFTKDEQKAVREAVLGTPAQNILRQLGRMAPGTGGLSNMLWSGATGGAGFATGMAGALPIMALGAGAAGARAGSAAMTRAAAQRVADIIVSGGSRAAVPQKQLSAQRKAIVDALMRSGGQQLPGYTDQ